jgi:multidrug resistance efflux pump
MLRAARNLSNIKRRLIQAQRPAASPTPDANLPPGGDAVARRELPKSATRAPTESIGVLKKMVERAKSDYEIVQKLVQEKAVSERELARAKSEYEISIERLQRAERAIRFYKAQVAVAEADYQQLVEANKRAPQAVSESHLRRAQLEVERAKAQLEVLGQ